MGNEQLLDVLLRITDALAEDMSSYLRSHGLTTARAHLLWTLYHGGPAMQRDLALALGHSPRHVTTLVDESVTAGHVVRRDHPADRRAVLVELTPRAVELLDTMAASHRELADQLFGHLTPGARRQLGTELARLAERLTAAPR
ncbi:MarR family transcriptional regulator [Auraticoccus sp. F435]|uniref:MarR family transcriptional regulator n=1 Tax=Auraticoccus cholistanensis TaxID=2656650 RepID=A0A6A9V0T0_9ACTN|nr:MarR family transcriptional regulator [Auraticoccus cholistanensis]MVA75910.1 MarR family transcriptional regulator [Auraticoccus cholistanensis]